MMYFEMSAKEALELCGKDAKVLVATQNLETNNGESLFVRKNKKDLNSIFEDVQTVAALFDDFMKQMELFTVKQDIYNVKPKGVKKTILLRI